MNYCVPVASPSLSTSGFAHCLQNKHRPRLKENRNSVPESPQGRGLSAASLKKGTDLWEKPGSWLPASPSVNVLLSHSPGHLGAHPLTPSSEKSPHSSLSSQEAQNLCSFTMGSPGANPGPHFPTEADDHKAFPILHHPLISKPANSDPGIISCWHCALLGELTECRKAPARPCPLPPLLLPDAQQLFFPSPATASSGKAEQGICTQV